MHSAHSRARAVLLTLFLALACSDGGDPVDPDPDPEGIGPAGGTVMSDDGVAMLAVPPGALDEEVVITIEPADAPPADPGLVPGTAFDFEPDGLAFDEPAVLAIQYDEDDLPAGATESGLRIARAVGSAWVVHGSSLVNPTANTVSATITGFSTWAIVYRAEDVDPPPAGIDAAVVDAPEASWQFTEVAPAAAYACANAAETTAVVELRTDRVLPVDSLRIECALRVQIAEGFTPRLSRSTPGPMRIRTFAPFDISGLPIDGADGLVIEAGGYLRMVGLSVAGPVDVHVVEPPATVSGRGGYAEVTGGFDIADVNALGSFEAHVEYGANGDYDFKMDRISSGEVGFEATGEAYLGAGVSAHVGGTIANKLTIDTNLRVDARVDAVANVGLDLLDGTFDLNDAHEVKIEENLAAETNLDFKGVGKGTVSLNANRTGATSITASADLDIEAVDQIADRLGLRLVQESVTPKLRYEQNGGLALGVDVDGLAVESESARLELDLSLMTVTEGIEARGRMEGIYNMTDVTAAYASVEAVGGTATVHGKGSNFNTSFGVVAGPAALGVDVTLNDVEMTGRGLVSAPPNVSLHARFDVIKAAGMLISRGGIGGNAPGQLASAAASAAEGDSIIIRDAVITAPDTATAGIVIYSVTEPILIERVNVSGAPVGIMVQQAGDDLTIRGSRIAAGDFAGIVLLSVSGTTLIEADTITGTSAPAMIFTAVSDPTVRDVEVDMQGGGIAILTSATPQLLVEGGHFTVPGVSGVQVGDFSMLTIDGTNIDATSSVMIAGGELDMTNATVTGTVFVGQAARAAITGNTFSGDDARIADVNMGGGLFVNPVGSNAGLAPDEVVTFVDFDGNGCADYPTPYNLKDAEGNCAVDGVPPPTR